MILNVALWTVFIIQPNIVCKNATPLTASGTIFVLFCVFVQDAECMRNIQAV